MNGKKRIFSLCLLFISVFTASALVTVHLTGALPNRLIRVDWNESVGNEYPDLPYENNRGHRYDLYMPANLDKRKPQYFILYIHGGSFNSGSKEDGELWCKFYASQGYIVATLDYSLQTVHEDATLLQMNTEIKACVKAVRNECEKLGIALGGMAVCGVSAGGTLAMNYAYTCADTSAVPVKFVFVLAAPADFEPNDWGLLKKVNGIQTDEEFVESMTGISFTAEEIKDNRYNEAIRQISPARLVSENTVPTLCGYGLKDHVIPPNQRERLVDALEKNGVAYDYLEFPHSNHGMYADIDVLQRYLELSLAYCNRYFR